VRSVTRGGPFRVFSRIAGQALRCRALAILSELAARSEFCPAVLAPLSVRRSHLAVSLFLGCVGFGTPGRAAQS
jgi:hypothetical protein